MILRHSPAAARMADIAPFHVMELMARAQALEAAGRDIVHMEVGEPDFPTPEPVCEAARAFIATGRVRYTHALGLPALREAVAAFYELRHGLRVDPRRIVVTAGASGALLLALALLVGRDDEWLLPDPGYPCNRHFVRLLEGRPVPLPVTAETGFQPTGDQVLAAWGERTRALMVASPANPTGTMLDRERLADLWRAVRARGGILVADEIYQGLTYGATAATALALSDDVFVINSFSKYFNMTGWRLGWLVAPEGCVRDVEKLAQNLFISPSAPAQHGALAAFQPTTLALLEERREEFRRRRDVLLPGLRNLGFRVPAEPEGAFYVYADIADLAADSFEFAGRLIESAGVAATPGLDFGINAPGRHMRFAYTVGTERLAEGLERIGRLLRA
ncbi:MAG: pyridoxal phosphate-dependent aminotransferase [Rhodocyclaceae bacterium]|nr:pyridoxal phosphate-dependent aminotransferase [Rhodocyclaceae bacterium]